MPDMRPNIRLLQAEVDPGQKEESNFRILVEGKYIKYLDIAPGLYDPDDMCFEPVLVTMIPPLPPDGWKHGRILNSPETGEPHFQSVHGPLAGIVHAWHPLNVDYLELQIGEKVLSNVYEATCPRFDSKVIVKFARFEWELAYYEAETAAYDWIKDHDIGPRFLAHLTEDGRIIGFVVECIPNYHHATLEDLSKCEATLSKLHKLGIKHGDTNKHNFLIHNGRATLIDFEGALRCDDSMVLEEEYQGLQEQLEETTGRGWMTVVTEDENNPDNQP